MKIGIMTFWWSKDNYGQILQCYALQKYLRDKGHDAYIIKYNPINDYKFTPFYMKVMKAFNPIKLYNFLDYKVRSFKSKYEQAKNPRNFEEFFNNHLQYSEILYTSYNELKQNPPEADAYIVGSDQVWNFQDAPLKKVENLVDAYFLNFGNDSLKRMSYAASWSQQCIPLEFEKYISPLLKKFDYVSVREKSGLKICENIGVDAQWVPDPTMILDKEVYLSLYNNKDFPKPNKPYLFFYFLGNKTEISKKSIYEWAKKRNLEVIYVTGNNNHDRYPKTYAGIEHWLFLLSHAEYVITNSYHCAVFSTIFNKKYGVLPLKGKDRSMNTRFDSLWELFRIEKRILTKNIFEVIDKPYIYNFDKTTTEKFDKFLAK